MPDYELENKTEEKWEESWNEIWKPLLYKNGKLDEEQIKNEMHDLWFIYEQVSEVYMYITGGMLSKPMYYANVIKQKHDEACQESYDEGFQEGVESSNSKEE